MGDKTIKQHFVPQFYLKRFTESNGRFSVYDIKSRIILTRQRPRGFATKRYFYDIDKKNSDRIIKRNHNI